MPGETFWPLFEQFRREVYQAEHRILSEDPHQDGGIFRYEDPKRPGTFRQVFMAADASLVPPLEGKKPTCSDDYPTLQDQWREQCRIVEADPRLQKMIGGLPKKLPPTKVISTAQRSHP